MGKCENRMEIGGIDYLSPPFVNPELLVNSLAVRTVAVAAGAVVKFHMSAVRTDGCADSEFPGFAVQDRMGSLTLDIGLELAGRVEVPIGEFPYSPNFEVTHGKNLPSGQKGWKYSGHYRKQDGCK